MTGRWIPDLTIAELLTVDQTDSAPPYLRHEDGREVGRREIRDRAAGIAGSLAARGISAGTKVVTMMSNGADHIALVLALCRLGAILVPVNPSARGPGLSHVMAMSEPALVLADPDCVDALADAGIDERLIVTRDSPAFAELLVGSTPPPVPEIAPEDLRVILFTSGTTGPPKGVMVTERMAIASATATGLACDVEDGDVFLMWEPLHHVGGLQMCVLALMRAVTLVAAPRFSASRFWDQIRAHGVTKLHYLGGIVDILLRQPERADDRKHPVKLGFGAGCRAEAQAAFAARFGIRLHELYGMTEASSFTTINPDAVPGTIGRELPWFEAVLLDTDGTPVPAGEAGEMVTIDRQGGLITSGYYRDPEATARAIRDGRLHTGDLMHRRADGTLEFLGRLTDSIRRRGENISAWEVEQVLAQHPDIAECAVIGVAAEIGEQEIHAFVRLMDGRDLPLSTLAGWCQDRMPPHHVPRHFSEVEDFPRTPSQRIRKDGLKTVTIHDTFSIE